ncbi:hypothetical protein FRD01_19015 [Microvenator marinus]|uniref:Uncharacterized protein n=1 Tax=Microvenator marinus TaxID=2600177 RepID=A0A5B8XVS1_9DELT|nr:hypothetical protein [Microvenator marinus]QED29287.1 hypothetical protein FRD01_19015 [Microvenator marinus]
MRLLILLKFALAALLLLWGTTAFSVPEVAEESCPCHAEVSHADTTPTDSPCDEGCSPECQNCRCCGAHVASAVSRPAQISEVHLGRAFQKTWEPLRAPPEGFLSRIFVPPRHV